MPHKIVSRDKWTQERKKLLTKEKKFDKLRDNLSLLRRKLPWVRVDKEYVFNGPQGQVTLAELFAGRGQLIVYHFMLEPGWKEGCFGCSFVADHFTGFPQVHLAQRDVTLVAVSRAPLGELEAYKKRMGWDFKWLSSSGSDFNYDYQAAFKPGEKKKYYNFKTEPFDGDAREGLSVFAKDKAGSVFHTYSTYARGLDLLIGAYNFLDLTPMGRNEKGLSFPMAWVRRHDSYRRQS